MNSPFSFVHNKEQLNQEVLEMTTEWRDRYQCIVDAINEGRITKEWKTAKEIGINVNKLLWSNLYNVIEADRSTGVYRFRLIEDWED